MHSLALITLDIPRTEEQIEINTRIDKEIEKMELEVKKNPENYVMRFCWERYNNLRTEFSRKVQIEMESLMGRYSTETETPAYLEFCDMTEALQKEYSGTTDCLKLPQGLIAPTNSSAYLCRFVVRDGKVYEKHAGPANQERRTKRAKRIRAVCDYPLRKLYPDFGRFVEEWGGYDFYESQNAYGYYYNPQGEWDGYSIGGRWPYMLLVKADCSEYSPGEKSLLHEQKAAKVPEGYKWASAARKKDIAWDALRSWKNQKAAERFQQLEESFLQKSCKEGVCGHIVEDGIVFFGDYIYRKEETLNEYMTRWGFPADLRYPIYAHAFLDDKGWQLEDYWPSDQEDLKNKAAEWDQRLEMFLDSIPDEQVLVVVDCHK